MTPERLAAMAKEQARGLGFHAVGITDLSPTPHADAFSRWLVRGMAGEMSYMARQADRRREPATILHGATRAVVVTRHYDHREAEPPGPGTGRVAKYARGVDYHDGLRDGLERLASYLRSLGGDGTMAKAYADAGPVPERELAQRAGLGWIGKNTMLIDPHRGSYSFIAVVLTNLDLAPDLPFDADRCGSCRQCIDACPTGAIVEDRVLDARRCISYLTIEHRGEPNTDLAPRVGNWVFGCDVCQDACPWNRSFADAVTNVSPGRAELAHLDLAWLISIEDAEFERQFGDTALMRAGPRGMRRNASVALANARAGTPRDPSGDRRMPTEDRTARSSAPPAP